MYKNIEFHVTTYKKKEKASTKIVFHDVTYRKTRECLIKFLEELELING